MRREIRAATHAKSCEVRVHFAIQPSWLQQVSSTGALKKDFTLRTGPAPLLSVLAISRHRRDADAEASTNSTNSTRETSAAPGFRAARIRSDHLSATAGRSTGGQRTSPNQSSIKPDSPDPPNWKLLRRTVEVRMRGLEPPRGCPHGDLNAARLPIPPHPHVVGRGDVRSRR